MRSGGMGMRMGGMGMRMGGMGMRLGGMGMRLGGMGMRMGGLSAPFFELLLDLDPSFSPLLAVGQRVLVHHGLV